MHSSPIHLFAHSPILCNQTKHTSQNGLRPSRKEDFQCPTTLVNWGKGTRPNTFDIRMSEGGAGSAMSLQGLAIHRNEINAMLGIGGQAGPQSIQFCTNETMSLRICMSGKTTCDEQLRALDKCLARIVPLKRAITQAGERYRSWFRVNVSDNFMKPLENHPVKWKHQRFEEFRAMSKGQGGRMTTGKYPKKFAWFSYRTKDPGYSKRPRLPINA